MNKYISDGLKQNNTRIMIKIRNSNIQKELAGIRTILKNKSRTGNEERRHCDCNNNIVAINSNGASVKFSEDTSLELKTISGIIYKLPAYDASACDMGRSINRETNKNVNIAQTITKTLHDLTIKYKPMIM